MQGGEQQTKGDAIKFFAILSIICHIGKRLFYYSQCCAICDNFKAIENLTLGAAWSWVAVFQLHFTIIKWQQIMTFFAQAACNHKRREFSCSFLCT